MLFSIRFQAQKLTVDFNVRSMPVPDSRLTITREISRSSITTVAEGYDTGLDRKVLVKSIHPQFARDSDLRARLDREARAIARISHPNVVRIYDLRAEGDEVSLVLEFVEGASLGNLLKEHAPLPLDVSLTILSSILDGLTMAHGAGIIHRDLKPDNVLISDRGEVKITDFGLASLRDQPSVTMEGMVIGTPSYMSPEQASGAELHAATDIFSAGLMLFEMLTGERVIKGTSLAEAYQNALKFSPPRYDDFRALIPVRVETVLRRMLEKSQEKRVQTADEARRMVLELLPTGPLPNALVADFFAGEGAVRATVSRTSGSGRWRHRLRTLSLVASAVVLVVLLSYTLIRYRSEPKVETSDTTGVISSIPVIDSAVVASPTDTQSVAQVESMRTIVTDTGGRAIPPFVPKEPESGNGKITAREGPSLVEITTRPWATVFVNDSSVGITPLRSPLSLIPGTYSLVFMNPEIGLPITRQLQLEAADTVRLDLNLYEYVARFRVAAVKPWADLYINDTFVLRTPSAQTIFRPLGTYRLTLKHPGYPAHSEEVIFEQGDPIHEIRFDFTQL